MKSKFKSPLFLLLIMVMLSGFCQSQQQDIHKSFLDLHLLLGTWSMETERGMLYESWQKMNDSTLMGKSYKVNGKDTVMTEQVELVSRKGKIMYIPTVEENNNKPVAFILVRLENRSYTFENKAHDFPQRIIYNLPQKNTMHAWIEGNMNGQFKRSDFKYVKTL
jgi:hypothetical protein